MRLRAVAENLVEHLVLKLKVIAEPLVETQTAFALPGNPLPGRYDGCGVRTAEVRRPDGGPSADAVSQPHVIPRGVRTKSPAALTSDAGQARLVQDRG